MNFIKDAHARTKEEVLDSLRTSSEGLSDKEASLRIKDYGRNELPKEKKQSQILLYLKQFNNSLNYVLMAAAGLSWATGHVFDAGAILMIIFMNGTIGYYQEHRAEEAIKKLRDMTVPVIAVRREGKTKRIPAAELVPGDIVILSEGGRVPADIRLIRLVDLKIDESALTGESLPSSKKLTVVGVEASVGDRFCMAYMGTLITGGEGEGVVVTTGHATEFGKIAKSLIAIKRDITPFERRMNTLGRTLGIISVGAAGLIFVVGILRGEPFVDMALFAVATAVAAIPEGLPFVLILVLSIGVWRMAKRNAITRHMPAVETLGIVDIICTDKTGTLTENKMTVRRVVTFDHTLEVTGEGNSREGDFLLDGTHSALAEHPTSAHLIRVATLTNKASIEEEDGKVVTVGDPTEAALVVLGVKAGFHPRAMRQNEETFDEIPFSSERKFRAMLHEYEGPDGKPLREIMVVGAFEVLLERSSFISSENREQVLTEAHKKSFAEKNEVLASQAMRVLSVAVKRVDSDMVELLETDLEDMTMLGLVGMIDPPHPGIEDAVRRAKAAGIRLIMNTGDHRTTAVAIAKEIGMMGKDDSEEGRVFTDNDATSMSDEELVKVLKTATVFARVSPSTKLRIVQLLQNEGHAVAMTGDGINDAPSLKQADIGIAMGINGTDVTKEVADMVLTDDNFGSIVNAVEEGRIVFRNVKQTTGFMIMTNAGEVFTLLTTIVLGLPLPLLPVQLLWLNIVTDALTDEALAAEGSHGDELTTPPRSKTASILTKDLIVLTFLTSLLMAGGTIGLFIWALEHGSIEYARSVAFVAMSLFQLWNIFNMRSASRSIFQLGILSNKWVLGTVTLSLLLMMMIMYVPFFEKFLHLKPLGVLEWALATFAGFSVIILVELYKVLIRRGIIPQSWV